LAAQLEKRMQNLIVAERELSFETAKRLNQAELLDKIAKDISLSEKQRVEALKEAGRITTDALGKEIKLAKERLDIIQQQNSITDSSEEDLQKEADQKIKILELEKRLSNEVQKLKNDEEQLRKSIRDAELERAVKAQEEIKKIFDAEYELELARVQNKKRLIELNAKQTKQSLEKERELELRLYGKTQEQIKSINEKYNKKISESNINSLISEKELDLQIQQMQQDKLLESDELLDSERTRIVEEGRIRRLEIEQEYNEKIIAENIKTADIVVKTWDERFQEFFQNLFGQVAGFGQTVNQALSVASQAVSVKLDKDLNENEKRRKKDLALFGKNQQQRDAINKKYDDIAEKRRKQAAKDDATIKQIQAVINTATGVTQALAQSGPAGIITGALVAAAGALEVAAIQQNKGKLAKGGLIKIGGKSHMEGGTTFRGTDGTVFEAEKDEVLAVVNKRDSAKLSLLSKINSVHGNPFFSKNRPSFKRNYFADGGLVARYSANNVFSDSQNRNATIEAVQKQPDIIVRVTDINSAQGTRAIVKERANVTK